MAKKFCTNCHHPLPYKAKFCAYCGQKNQDGKVPVGDLVQQVWFKVFHLESRYFTAIFRLLIPGQVSLDYFSGKRKRYPPPVQLFFVVMFFFLFVATHSDWGNGGAVKVRSTAEEEILSDKGGIQSTAQPATPAPAPSDFFKALERAFFAQQMQTEVDSLSPVYHTPEFRAGLDTLLRRTLLTDSLTLRLLGAETDDSTGTEAGIDSFSIGLGFSTYRFANKDVFLLSTDQLLDRYHIDQWLPRLLVGQSLKVMRDPESLMHSYLGSLAWTLFVMVILGAGGLMLLYIRRQRYYVEHLIFLLHLHSGYGLLLTGGLLLTWLGAITVGWVIGLTVLWATLSSWVAIYRYYRQSKWVTTLKWFIFGVFYLLIGALTFTASLAVVLALF